MLNNSVSANKVADEISKLVPKFMRGIRSDIFKHKHMTNAQIIILTNLYETGKSKVCTLAKALAVSAPTMSGVIERMVKQGYLERFTSRQDRRCIIISLKPKGKRIVKDLQKAIRKHWSQILIYLTPSERLTYVRLLKKIVKAIEKSRGSDEFRQKIK